MKPHSSAELILRSNGAVYHLNLLPHQLAHKVVTVGDPERIPEVTRHFSSIAHQGGAREFQWVTGTYRNTALTVLSTGIGTDNVDIVWNELDALVNINLTTRQNTATHTPLQLMRIGTSGALQKDIPLGTTLFSQRALALDGLPGFYAPAASADPAASAALASHLGWAPTDPRLTILRAGSAEPPPGVLVGSTITAPGFYAPQGRQLRAPKRHPELLQQLVAFTHNVWRFTNLEMETSALFLLADLLGHEAYSFNAILANRMKGEFHAHPEQAIGETIELALTWFSGLE